MALTIKISNAEISPDPDTGKLTGDEDPSLTQEGLTTKFRDSDDQVFADIAALDTVFQDHDHDATNPTGPGGPPIGTGGVRSIQVAAIITRVIGPGAITGGKTASGAITTEKILDDSIEKAQIGVPSEKSATVNPGSALRVTHGLGRRVMYCFAANGPEAETVTHNSTDAYIEVQNPASGGPVPITIYYEA